MPGHVEPVVVPSYKPQHDDDEHDPHATSSTDPAAHLPIASQPSAAQSVPGATDTSPEMVALPSGSDDTIPYSDNEESQIPVLSEDDIHQLPEDQRWPSNKCL